ncbi:unnamed protein product [Calicophoron daubneyi]|uniref:ERC protein 2 n=1 Tax=Calicophoron daubneyi TaxID=300641 RepID=A0AAV2TGD4_CALDB
MEGLDQRSPYHHGGYRGDLSYPTDSSLRGRDRPRPASARDLGYGDMYDSGIHPQSTSPRTNPGYGDNPGEIGIDSRNPSLDRRAELYGTLRGNLDQLGDPMIKPSGRQVYGLKSLASNPGLGSVLGSGGQTHRRAHSYDMNLEKQGLADYNNLLAAAGIGANPGIYGNPGTQLLDYGGLAAPTVPPLGTMDYGTYQRTGYPTLQAGSGLLNLGAISDLTVLQRECLCLQHELEITKEKLNACTASIRTFWSPELKRERSMRKEENAKYAILADHLHQLQLEKQTMLETLHNVEDDLRRERDYRIRGRYSNEPGSEGLSELELAKRQVDELTMENRQLKKAIEEADRRTANAKASLTATEESLRRLVEAVKAGKASAPTTGGSSLPAAEAGGTTATGVTGEAGGTSVIRLERIEADRAEISRLRTQLNEACTRGSEAERQLVERNFEFSRLKEEFNMLLQDHQQIKDENESLRQDTRQTQTLQSLVDTKESKIMTLENEIRLLEDEITRLRDDGLITPNTSTSSGIDDLDKTLQAFRSNERLLKSKVELLNSEISKRDCEIYTLQSRLEMTDKQHQDQTHHISVLKEQVKTREHKIGMLTADTEDFRKRLKEKESQLEKKTKALSAAQATKRQMETELAELKDQLDIKERKISLLQRKIENLEDLLNDKDNQLAASKARLSRISSERMTTDGTRVGLEETLKDKDRQIERLKDARQRTETDSTDEVETQKRTIAEMRSRLEAAQREIEEKATQLLELREEVSELRKIRFKYDSEISQLQGQINQRASEFAALQMEKQVQHKQITTEYEMKYAQRIAELESQANHYMETASKLQSEVDRLLRALDTEKFERDKQVREVQDELREAQNNLNSLKRTQQAERKKQTQLLEEAQQREENAHSDVEILKGIMSDKDSRIRELEQALRESVRLTAERELYASGRDDETRQLEQQMRDLRTNLEQLQRERNNLSAQLATVQEELSDREGQLKTLEQECNYLPELEKLRRSNHEANLRIAALIKISQGREHTLTDQDRNALSTIPLFPNLSPSTAWSTVGTAGSRYLPGSGGGGYLAPYQTGAGGATSPHLAGSAFQLIGNASSAMAAAIGGRASVPGQPVPSPDVVMLTKMLQDKEQTLQQHLQELTHLRFQNSELEIRLKATQRELDAKTTRLSILETTTQYPTSGLLDVGSRSPTGTSGELAQLRRSHHELTIKMAQLQIDLDEKERQLRAADRLQTSSRPGTDFSEMATLRRELITVKAEKETELLNLNNRLEKLKQDKIDLTNELQDIKKTLAENTNQLQLAEAAKDKEVLDREALQKKYEAVLTQLSEKTEKIQKLEADCQTLKQTSTNWPIKCCAGGGRRSGGTGGIAGVVVVVVVGGGGAAAGGGGKANHLEQLKRQKSELDDLRHHTTYLQNTIQERENRIELVEKESFKLRDELIALRKQLTVAESEVKTLQEEAAYREDRLRQLQAQHTEELSRLRTINQEQSTKNSHLEMTLDEKEHQLKSQESEIRCQSDELARLQSTIEDTSNRLTVSQKRVEEREIRLRKLEKENHELLDEIHGLRKGNKDLESEVDSLRQRLLDRQERPGSTVPPSSLSPPTRLKQSGSLTAANMELDRLRKQQAELKSTYEHTQKSLEELQIQFDQMTVQRNNLRTQLEEEIAKRAKLEEKLHSNEDEWKARLSKAENSDQSKRAVMEAADLRNELERKEAQITCLKREMDRLSSSSALRDRYPDSSQQLLIADLEVRLRQATEERDQARDQLAAAMTHAETSYMETQQQLLVEKQTLHQQVANLTQTAHNATTEADRYQRELRQANSRVQQLSRQLQETQTNCDAIARQRDSLRDQLDQFYPLPGHDEASIGHEGLGKTALSQPPIHGRDDRDSAYVQLEGRQLKRTQGRPGSAAISSVANLFGMAGTGTTAGMRPASVGPGSHENVGVYSTGGGASTSQLSRELDRVHREYEATQSQLKSAQEAEERSRNEAQKLRDELQQLKNEVGQHKDKLRELQDQKDAVEAELSKRKREESERNQASQNEANDRLRTTQQQLTEKTNQLDSLTHQLNNTRQYCTELEHRINDMTQRLAAAESQTQQQTGEIQRQQQLQNECNSLRNEVRAKDSEIQRMSIQLDQLTREYQNQERTLEQMTIELSTAQASATEAKREAQRVREQGGPVARESDQETVQILRKEISESAASKREMEQALSSLQNELNNTRKELDEKSRALQMLENNELRKQKEEVANLQRELQAARLQIQDLGGSLEPGAPVQGAPLKIEIDTLKREIAKRDDTIARMEKDCQEKHLRRIEAMQAQLHRFEEEASNLNKVLDEQRTGLEERDQLIRQLRSNQSQASNVELEKLRNEHARCKEKFDQQTKRINTLAEQIESQSDEILAIKQEALTASLCEKEANIALMEVTAPKNAASTQALNKLRAERDQLQTQQKQLANTRAMLAEERKSRK